MRGQDNVERGRGLGPFTGRQLTIVIVAICAVVALPTAAGAAAAAFSNNSSTVPAVKATNANAGGIGVQGVGGKYGLYSSGPLGVATGKPLVCAGCVGASDLAASAQPSVVSKDGNTTVAGSVGNTCTNLGSITITAAAAGKITVDVDVHLTMNHTNGSSDWFQMMLATSSSDCSIGASLYADVYVDATEPTRNYKDTLHLMETFSAAAAASYTYYVNVKWPFGGDPGDSASYPNLRAMFFPN